jgi:hypothetical protein
MTQPTWIEALEDRTSYVIRLMRVEDSSLDDGEPDNAFAFILGTDEDNALVVEGTVSGDNGEAIATLWALRDGRKVPVSVLEIDDQLMVTHALA